MFSSDLWGIGKKLIALGLPVGLLMLALMLRFPAVFFGKHCMVWRTAGGLLLGAGLGWLYLSVRTLLIQRRRGALAATGTYACSRNPLYFAWIALIVPGLSFLLCSWGLLPVSLALYWGFSRWVSAEEAQLRTQFGAAYEQYAAQTARFWTWHCLKARRGGR